MIIICDVDGVVADLHTPWLQRYNEMSGDSLTVDKIVTWHISDYVKPEYRSRMFDILREPDLYKDVKPIPGALEAIQYLRTLHRVVFATSCVKGMADQKWEWLEANGALPRRYSHKDLVVTTDKALIQGDVIIDDSMEHCLAFNGGAVLFDQPWNRDTNLADHSTWCHRAAGWQKTIEILQGQFA